MSDSEEYGVLFDFGMLYGRVLLVQVFDGPKIATAVYKCPHTVIDKVLP